MWCCSLSVAGLVWFGSNRREWRWAESLARRLASDLVWCCSLSVAGLVWFGSNRREWRWAESLARRLAAVQATDTGDVLQ